MKTIDLDFIRTPVFYSIIQTPEHIQNIGLQGSTSSTKTYSALQVLAVWAMEKQREIRVAGYILKSVKDGALKDFKRIVLESDLIRSRLKGTKEKDYYHGTSHTFTFKNGSTIQFVGFDTPGKAKLAGKVDIYYVNEVNLMPKPIFEMLFDRSKERLLFDFNSTSHFYIHDEYIPRDDTKLYISNYKHAFDVATGESVLTDKTIRSIERYASKEYVARNGTDMWRVYGLGLTGRGIDTVFKKWRVISDWDTANVIKWYKGADFGAGIDPDTLVRAGVTADNYLVIDQMMYDSESDRGTEQLSEYWYSLPAYQRGKEIVADAHGMQLRLVNDLSTYGHNMVPSNLGAGSVSYGIKLMKSFKGILITSRSKDIVREFQLYKWINKNGVHQQKPKGSDHGIDPVRYIVMEYFAGKRGGVGRGHRKVG